MHSARQTVFSLVLIALTAFGVSAANFEFDDEEPEVTDRVARISSISGDISIRRSGVDEWEKAVLNLPVVEGDEITAADGSRFEIQFDANTHVRVAANSYLKITTLSDGGIALSLAEGSMSLSASKFDLTKKFFEIDAPKTTIAVQRSGRYRIDAGKVGSQEVRVNVLDDGEARVYSSNSGFTVRDGRSAKIYVEGPFAGESENGYAPALDDFELWVAERIDTIAKRLSTANYGQYYDNDIYGAEDLNDNGDWVHTKDYGFVWRPNVRSISGYANWSPYRYGSWRWLPSYGWTWVNDEPWGWATYHHGRWVWYNSGWYWSPYSYYRNQRSWWRPALVVIRVIDSNVCWYPMSYRRRYRNHHRPNDGRPRPGNGPVATATPRLPGIDPGIDQSDSEVPETGVVGIPLDKFGKRRVASIDLPPQTRKRAISDRPTASEEIKLPTMDEIKSKVDPDIRAQSPPIVQIRNDSKIGAERREKGVPLDDRLRNKIIYGNRPVIQAGRVPDDSNNSPNRKSIPATGAVERPPVKAETPVFVEPVRERPRVDRPKTDDTPVRTAPTRSEPYKRSEPPRDDTPVRQAPTRSEPTKQPDPPKRSEPTRSEPTRKSDPPPQKSEPSKSSPPSESKKKDNR